VKVFLVVLKIKQNGKPPKRCAINSSGQNNVDNKFNSKTKHFLENNFKNVIGSIISSEPSKICGRPHVLRNWRPTCALPDCPTNERRSSKQDKQQVKHPTATVHVQYEWL